MTGTIANVVMSPTEPVVALGRRVLELEAREIRRAASRLDQSFARAVELLHRTGGRVIVSGIGKSGLIARKLAATLTSTGTPASYLHPVDSLHGDLGIVGAGDVAIIMSKSGESDELVGLLGALQRMGVPVIAITGSQDSFLRRMATVTLDADVEEEACPHDLAPTTSTTVALALGDALAMALLEVNGFGREDFAVLHPGGTLNRKVLLRVRDVMLPPGGQVAESASLRDVVIALARHRGMALVADAGRLVGVFTAGDLTRLAERNADLMAADWHSEVTRTPKVTGPDDFAVTAVATMEQYGILVLPVVEEAQRLAGVVHLHDLMKAGAV